MLVSVYLLRHKGERLPLEDASTKAPYRGYIRITREPGGRVGRWQRTALLMAAPSSTNVIIQLHRVAEPVLWDERGLLLAGSEYEWDRKRQTTHRQSWLIKFNGGIPASVKQPGVTATWAELVD